MNKVAKYKINKVRKHRSYLRRVHNKHLLNLLAMYLDKPVYGFIACDNGKQEAFRLVYVERDGTLHLDNGVDVIECSPDRFVPNPAACFWLQPLR